MKTLTVFTPTFNRAYCIYGCYESLCRQTSQDFEWLVIDDGSTDNTGEIIDGYIAENKIRIRYIYQENQGMHGAHNTAYRNIHTELNVCIDSDDYMPDDAVESIVTFWKEKGNSRYAGIVGLDVDISDKIIGTSFIKKQDETTITGFYAKGGKGDKKLVYRTDVLNNYPEYPIFEGEKYVSLAYKYVLVDQDYKLLILNKPLVVVEYRPDGSTLNMLKQYKNNPKGFAFARIIGMKYAYSNKRRFVECIHYVSSSILSKNKFFLKKSPFKFYTILALPFGIALTIFINIKTKK